MSPFTHTERHTSPTHPQKTHFRETPLTSPFTCRQRFSSFASTRNERAAGRRRLTSFLLLKTELETIRDALELFLEKRVSGAPVVNSDGGLVGVLSMTDIIWVESTEAMQSVEFPFYPSQSTDETALEGTCCTDPGLVSLSQPHPFFSPAHPPFSAPWRARP